MLAHPHRMAEFSNWANSRLLAAAATLSTQALSADRGAFFDSIIGTLNHILLVDLLYRERLEGQQPSRFGALNEILHADVHALSAAQQASDAWYLDYTSKLDEQALATPVGFSTLLEQPEYWEVSHSTYFSNLFQHQVHHRGQAHNMLPQANIEPPALGFIEFEVARGERIIRRLA